MAENIEARVLCREIADRALGGIAARLASKWAAVLLPTVSHAAIVSTAAAADDAFETAKKTLFRMGTAVPEFPVRDRARECTAVVGAGIGGLNPCLVHVKVTIAMRGSTISLRAVAKEGLVRQATAEKAVTTISAALRSELGEN